MLQFILDIKNPGPLTEQARIAIEGGCSWAVLADSCHGDNRISDSEAQAVADICREAGIILTVENDPELAQKLGAHGFVITDKNCGSAVGLRGKLGAEAIIGEVVSTAASAAMLERSDIDYGVIDPALSLEDAMKLVGDTRETGCRLPLVLTGDFDATDVPVIKAVGASGVATSRKLIEAADPVAAVRQLIDDLNEEQIKNA
ncbi:MAG: thiamine phosphate synthase [Muribaculaceae bacterium]